MKQSKECRAKGPETTQGWVGWVIGVRMEGLVLELWRKEQPEDEEERLKGVPNWRDSVDFDQDWDEDRELDIWNNSV